jgi:lipopolysaccharide biosynthesis protein
VSPLPEFDPVFYLHQNPDIAATGVDPFGHYQPRTPRDLGHYTLDCTEPMQRQIAMARGAGLHGFVHYFYWFNGNRMLEKPVDAMLADPTLDFPFALMWANENWTRRWDGSDDEVLISKTTAKATMSR